MKKQLSWKWVLVILGVIVAVVIAFNCFTEVPTGHTGVVTTFGRVENFTLDAGIHFKAPWQEVIKMDNRIQKASQELACSSADIQAISIKYTVNYQISKSNAMTIYSTIGQDYYETIIVPGVAEAVKNCTAKYTAEELVANRTELASKIEEELEELMNPYNIVIVESAIENMDFTEAFTSAVEAKQVAQQEKLKAEIEAEQKKIEAQAQAEVKKIEAEAEAYQLKIKAEAEAEANELITKSLTEEILAKMYYDAWDGVLPKVVTDGGVMLNIPITEEE